MSFSPLIRPAALILFPLFFGRVQASAESHPLSPPPLELVTATMNVGPGKEPPPGSRPAIPSLTGVIRAHGLDPRRSNFRITLLVNSAGPAAYRLKVTGWNAKDPKAPAQIRFTARWPASAPFEGCTVRVDYARGRTRHSTHGPVRVFMLPGRPPSGHRPSEQQER